MLWFQITTVADDSLAADAAERRVLPGTTMTEMEERGEGGEEEKREKREKREGEVEGEGKGE